MLTRFFLFLRQIHYLLHRNKSDLGRTERRTQKIYKPQTGQVLVIFAFSATVLILCAGLAVDAGSLYVAYAQLKRGVDAAAVAAANSYKRIDSGVTTQERLDFMKAAAQEVLELNNVDINTLNWDVYICDADGDGLRDATLQAALPKFYDRCPDTPGEPARKLVWVEAEQRAPLYFLHLIGIQSINLKTDAIAESAPLDIVLVLDTSESMANASSDWDPSTSPGNYDPSTCNAANSCQPMLAAKTDALLLLNALFEGYDRIAVVTYDFQAQILTDPPLTTDLDAARDAITNIQVHDDFEFSKLWPTWRGANATSSYAFNPINPEDRDANGTDLDTMTALDPNWDCPLTDPAIMADRWWTVAEGAPDPFGWGGVPCDDGSLYDAFDYDNSGEPYSSSDDTTARSWLTARGIPINDEAAYYFSPLSTCSGCGMRAAANILKNQALPGSVRVIIFLSDGMVNRTELPSSIDPYYNAPMSGVPEDPIDPAFVNGYCTGGGLGGTLWKYNCNDTEPYERHCIDSDPATCPPDAAPSAALPWHITPQTANASTYLDLDYSPLDYALDMVDHAALTSSENGGETLGRDIVIYAIGLGAAGNCFPQDPGNDLLACDESSTPPNYAAGEIFLRYMAAVGDDGNRETDQCVSHNILGIETAAGRKQSCGNYYYASSGADLEVIFRDISNRIFTRIRE